MKIIQILLLVFSLVVLLDHVSDTAASDGMRGWRRQVLDSHGSDSRTNNDYTSDSSAFDSDISRNTFNNEHTVIDIPPEYGYPPQVNPGNDTRRQHRRARERVHTAVPVTSMNEPGVSETLNPNLTINIGHSMYPDFLLGEPSSPQLVYNPPDTRRRQRAARMQNEEDLDQLLERLRIRSSERAGENREGRNREGRNREGRNREGMNREGRNREG